MAIRATMQENEIMAELQAKLGEANIEIVFDSEDDQIIELNNEEDKEEEE